MASSRVPSLPELVPLPLCSRCKKLLFSSSLFLWLRLFHLSVAPPLSPVCVPPGSGRLQYRPSAGGGALHRLLLPLLQALHRPPDSAVTRHPPTPVWPVTMTTRESTCVHLCFDVSLLFEMIDSAAGTPIELSSSHFCSCCCCCCLCPQN